MMKKILLVILIISVLFLTGCGTEKNSEISVSQIEIDKTISNQNVVELSEEKIKDSLLNCKWLVTNVLDLNGNQSKITRLNLLRSIYKSLDGIKLYEDGRFTNNIGISAHGEEAIFKDIML